MTMFYTDYVAKDWVNGVGTGVHADAVAGFEPDTTPPHRGRTLKDDDSSGGSGRLWSAKTRPRTPSKTIG